MSLVEARPEPRNAEKAEAVRQTREEFPKAKLKELLAIAKLSKSAYLYCVKRPNKDAKNAQLMIRIKEIFDVSKSRYGVRRADASLRSVNVSMTNAKVNRLMRNAREALLLYPPFIPLSLLR